MRGLIHWWDYPLRDSPLGINLDMKPSNFFVDDKIIAFDKETFNEVKPVALDLANPFIVCANNFLPYKERLVEAYCGKSGDDPENLTNMIDVGILFRGMEMLAVYSRNKLDHHKRPDILKRMKQVLCRMGAHRPDERYVALLDQFSYSML